MLLLDKSIANSLKDDDNISDRLTSTQNVLRTDQNGNSFPYLGRINTRGTGFHLQPRIALDDKTDYIRPDFKKNDLVFVVEITLLNWLKVERIDDFGNLEIGYVDYRYVDKITFDEIPYVIDIDYSDREAGRSRDGTRVADDLIYGDLSRAELEDILPTIVPTSTADLIDSQMDPFLDKPDYRLFSSFRLMVRTLFTNPFGGNMATVMEEMIDKFERSEGGIYSSLLLDNAAQNHPEVAELFQLVRQLFDEKVREYDGNVLRFFQQRLGLSDRNRPAFNYFWRDTVWGGLTIAVNDTWSFVIRLIDYDIEVDRYRAKIQIILYDHFGLDVPDVAVNWGRVYGKIEGFRSWFVLQHQDTRAYQPFITQINVSQSFEGSI